MAQAAVQSPPRTFRVSARTELVPRALESSPRSIPRGLGTPPVKGMPQPQPVSTSVKGMPAAPYQLVQGVPGAWKGVLQATLLRSVLIGGGLYVAGVRSPVQLGVGALAASGTLSLLQVASHAVRAR